MKRDQQLVSHFLSAFNQHHGASFRVVRSPDVENRRSPAIEAVAADDAGTTLAFEHTLIEPFEGERTDSARFMQVFGPLEGHSDLMRPGHNVRLGVKVGAIPNGVKWDSASHKVREHLADIVPSLGEGPTVEHIPGLSCPLSVEVDVERHGPEEADHVWVWRTLPADTLKVVVRRALDRKLKKLVAESATRHVLLLEQADIAHGHSNIRTAIDELSHEFPELARVDEIWLAITTCWETEDVLFFSELYPNVMDRRLKLDLRTSMTTALGARR
jgi:hypothetical protein